MHPLDIDFYKLTQQQFVFKNFYNAKASFILLDRRTPTTLSQDTILDCINNTIIPFAPEDISTIKSLGCFSDEYLNFLQQPINPLIYDFTPEGFIYKGFWRDAILVETRLLTLLSENLYRKQQTKLRSFTTEDDNTTKRIATKAKFYKDLGVKIAEFGTRRRANCYLQKTVIGHLINECGTNFIGTSNIYYGTYFNIPIIGTYGHEIVMGMNELNTELNSNERVLQYWLDCYSSYPKLLVALTDTYGSKNFFRTYFTNKFHYYYKAVRQDSGDPLLFTELFIKLLELNNLNPMDFTIMYSDNLNPQKVEKIHNKFSSKIKQVFCIGTDFTYDCFEGDYFGRPKYIVKMWTVNDQPVCKLTDDPEKAVGLPTVIEGTKNLINYIPLEVN